MKCFLIMVCLGSFFPLWAQHDGARNAVQAIARGEFGKVAQNLAKKKPFAGEAESRFVEMLSLLAQNKIDPALAKAKQAVAAGLPFERLIVGPRELLSRLHESDEFQNWRSGQDIPLIVHGPMLGSVTADSFRVWVRTSEPAKLKITALGSDQQEVAAELNTEAESDFTGVAQISGLKALDVYRIQIHDAETGDLLDHQEASIQTSPATGTPGAFKVAFGGGAGYVPKWERMWDTIRAQEVQAMLMLGDNVYIDQPQFTLCQHYCYYRRQSRPEWQRLVANTAIYSIWDDHDFADNDCDPGPHIDRPVWKRPVWNIFRQNWVNPSYGGGQEQPGCWYDFTMGDVHFIMLDGRFYRHRKSGSMLGPVQKQWLRETLTNSEGTFKLLVSPVPFTPGIKPGSKDPWDGFPEERQEIFSWLVEDNIEGVFLVAADRHRTDLRKIARPDGYDLYEFESSRLTNHHTHKVVQTDGLIWGYNKTCSFGLMDFDTTKPDPQVTFRCMTIDGEEKHSFVLKRSVLELP